MEVWRPVEDKPLKKKRSDGKAGRGFYWFRKKKDAIAALKRDRNYRYLTKAKLKVKKVKSAKPWPKKHDQAFKTRLRTMGADKKCAMVLGKNRKPFQHKQMEKSPFGKKISYDFDGVCHRSKGANSKNVHKIKPRFRILYRMARQHSAGDEIYIVTANKARHVKTFFNRSEVKEIFSLHNIKKIVARTGTHKGKHLRANGIVEHYDDTKKVLKHTKADLKKHHYKALLRRVHESGNTSRWWKGRR